MKSAAKWADVGMTKAVATAVISVLGLVSNAGACGNGVGNGGFAPENDVKIPVGRFGVFSIEEQMFNQTIDRAEAIYKPVFKAKGLTFSVERRWDDPTANAYADRKGTTANVHMFGGLARHPKVTADGFALVICHEIGHHLGGAPKVKSFFGTNAWASNEGEADYFATTKCAREFWKNDDNVAIVAGMEVDAIAKAGCEKAWKSAKDVALCERAAMGGKSLGDTLADLGKSDATDFSKPDPKKVAKTNDAHPEAQCRLDTYFAGTLCGVSKDVSFDDKDSLVGACNSEKGDLVGYRSFCWFKPKATRTTNFVLGSN